ACGPRARRFRMRRPRRR
ncbi:hypothetical protein MyNCGM152_59170, partial [Achromobacter xylosoxidans]